MNKGFGADTTFIVTAGDIKETVSFDGEAVKIVLSNGDKFTCGAEQEILIDNEWILAKDIIGKQVADKVYVDKVIELGVCKLYDLMLEEPHIFNIIVGNILFTVHNLNSLVNIVVKPVEGLSSLRGDLYLYIPEIVKRPVYISKVTTKKKQNLELDVSNLVRLGGTFYKVGEEDEVLGGGSQKVGAAIQR